MTVRPEPDRDSRFPDRYCTTCGKGFRVYLECGASPAGAASLQFDSKCNMDGVIPPDPPNPDWDKPLPEGCLRASEGCPNAPLRQWADNLVFPVVGAPQPTSDDGWTTAKIDSAYNEPRYIGIDYGAQPAVSIPHSGELPDDLSQRQIDEFVLAGHLQSPGELVGVWPEDKPHVIEPSTGSDDGWTTAPIVKK